MAKTLTERFLLAGAVTICEEGVAPVRALALIWGFLVLRNWGSFSKFISAARRAITEEIIEGVVMTHVFYTFLHS